MRERGKCDECEAPCERCNDFPIIKRAKAEATRKERERCAEVVRKHLRRVTEIPNKSPSEIIDAGYILQIAEFLAKSIEESE